MREAGHIHDLRWGFWRGAERTQWADSAGAVARRVHPATRGQRLDYVHGSGLDAIHAVYAGHIASQRVRKYAMVAQPAQGAARNPVRKADTGDALPLPAQMAQPDRSDQDSLYPMDNREGAGGG